MEIFLISLGGALGAPLRYAVGQWLHSTSFPWRTLTVNGLGSFFLGLVIFAASHEPLVLLVGVGFCGAFTTFSSFSFETVALWERGNPLLATTNALGNLLVSMTAYGLAWVLVGSSVLSTLG